MAIRYWLLVHPLDRANALIDAGIAQGRWNEPEPVRTFRELDGVVLYAPRRENPDGEPLRCAVSSGRVVGEPYLFGGHGSPQWVTEVRWQPDACLTPIRPLRDTLELTRNHRLWGERLRPGWVELSQRDFTVFEDALRRPAPEPGGFAGAIRTDNEAQHSVPDASSGGVRDRAERAWRDWFSGG